MSWEYFSDKEIMCNCGCGENRIHPGFMQRLTKAREYSGVSYPMNSLCRCAEHNKAEGGSDTSSHQPREETDNFCTAGDIGILNSSHRHKVLLGILKAGFTRIGIGKNFIHVDIDQSKSQGVTWHYYKKV